MSDRYMMHLYKPTAFESNVDRLFLRALKDLSQAPLVDTGHWQAKKDVPQTQTRELTNVVIQLPIAGSAGAWASYMKPNLPWAEDHFTERVGGKPLNPPPSHEYWPFNQAGNKEHMNSPQPVEIDERDWVHLACLIDGEGCITFRRGEKNRPQISISQKDTAFITEVYNRFRVGHIYDRKPRNRIMATGTLIESRATQWHISSTEEMIWVLEHILPHLVLKKDKAQKALDILGCRDPNAKGRRKFPDSLMEKAKFSHSYPERLWPRYAGGSRLPRKGIRYEYGDLNNAVDLLVQEPHTRQCFIPIWGMEDLYAAAVERQRVPCTLGYHLILRDRKLHCFYPMRSLDALRYLRDDFYMAGRLVQWLIGRCQQATGENSVWQEVEPGVLTVHAVSLHIFEGDLPIIQAMRKKAGLDVQD